MVQDCCTHVKGFIGDLENMYSDDELVDEELLEILYENPFQKKETQISYLHIQEKSQQLIISSSTERDMSQNSDSTNYISFLEVDDNFQQSCQSFCDRQRSWDCQSNSSLDYSTSEILLQEEVAPSQSENSILQQQSLQSYNTCVIDYIENDNSGKSQSCSPSTCSFSEIASKEKSDFEIMVEGRPLHVDQIQILPEDLHEYINSSFLVEDDQPSDLKRDGCIDLFSYEYSQPVTISVSE